MDYARAKRVLDIGLAGGGLIATAPLWLVIAVAIIISSGPPVLYQGDRLGLDGHVFGMYKFRSMRVGAHLFGPGVTGARDSRVTTIGRLLRWAKLDELAQLLNVLKGDMSIVGPRPEDPRYLPDYAPHQKAVLGMRPGITGPTQIEFRHEERLLTGPDVEYEYRTQLLPKKLDIDLEYVRNNSLRMDIWIMLSTVRKIFSREL